MARAIRQDTSEFLGYLIELYGPVPPWVKDWPFRAWRHPDGKLRNWPPVPVDGIMRAPPHLELRIPIRNNASGEAEVLVPPNLLDFIQNHSAFRALPNHNA